MEPMSMLVPYECKRHAFWDGTKTQHRWETPSDRELIELWYWIRTTGSKTPSEAFKILWKTLKPVKFARRVQESSWSLETPQHGHQKGHGASIALLFLSGKHDPIPVMFFKVLKLPSGIWFTHKSKKLWKLNTSPVNIQSKAMFVRSYRELPMFPKSSRTIRNSNHAFPLLFTTVVNAVGKWYLPWDWK